jgi:2-dehydropantoate 2-reductase
MKYAVIGLGAVGTVVGGILIHAGEDVVLIGKPPQVDKLRDQGISIKGLKTMSRVHVDEVSSDLAKIQQADTIFICVKSQDTAGLAEQLGKHLKSTAVLISLQNGVHNATVLKGITKKQALAGIVLFNAVYQVPGEVEVTIQGDILLEHDPDQQELLQEISSLFSKNGIPIKVMDDIIGYQWSKLLLNLQIAVTALTGQTIKESILDPDTRDILVATMKEGLQVCKQAGITLHALPGVDPQKMIKRLSTLPRLLLNVGGHFMGLKEGARNSMWQSLSRGKPTEIEYINGEIVKLAQQHNLKAPINEKLVDLIKQAEKTHATTSFQPKDLKRCLEVIDDT